MRWFCVLFLGVLALAACSPRADTVTPPPTLTFVPNDSSYAAHTDEQFVMTLPFIYQRQAIDAPDEITAVTLNPPSDLVQVNGFRILAGGIGNFEARAALDLELTARMPGEHTFTSITVTAAGVDYEAPLGTVRLAVVAGPAADLLVLFPTGGIFYEPVPNEFTLANPTATPVTLQEIRAVNPRITFDTSNIEVDEAANIEVAVGEASQPFPAEGLTIQPADRVVIRINWRVDLPTDAPIHIEVRPLLVIEQAGEARYQGMPAIAFQNDLAIRPLD